MKREAAIALLFISALGGCTKNNDLPFEDNNTQHTEKISLNVVNSDGNPLTRGSVVDTEAKMASVGMYCAHTLLADWSTSTSFDKMSNNKFTYSSAEWVWNTSDNDGIDQPTWGHSSLAEKYTFFAYAPHSSDVSDARLTANLVSAQPELSFTVTPNIAEQEDLMVAKPRKDIHPQSFGKVTMMFNHALTKVSFSVKGINTRKIKSITIKDVHNSGTQTFMDVEPYFEWSNQSGSQDYTISTAEDGGNGAILDVTPNVDENITTSLTADNGYLFMLPQDISGKTIEVVTVDLDGTHSDTEALTIPDQSAWTQSKHVNYVITIRESKVDLTFNILDWDEESVDVNTKGTYLNILDNSIGSFDGEDVFIYYSTDHRPDEDVIATYEKTDDPAISGSLDKQIEVSGNYFLFAASSLDLGDYIVTITAGSHLTRKLKVIVTSAKLEISILDWDDSDIEVSTPGTYLNVLDNSIGSFDGEDVFIYYSTDHRPDEDVTATYEKTNSRDISGNLTKIETHTSNYFILPASILDFGEYTVTIKAGKHLTRKLKVTIVEGTVMVSVVAWDDTDIEVSTQGSYLNIFKSSIGSFDGDAALIYYSTDHRPDDEVTATYENTVDSNINGSLGKNITSNGSYFIFPSSSLDFGEYIVTINAGKSLTRKLKVTIKKGEIVVTAIAWDDEDIDGSPEGSHITLSHRLVNISANETVDIHYSTDAKSVSASVDNAKITVYKSNGKIALTAAADIEAPASATLEIRADNITKKIRININQ